jgi:hypothetical protein
VIFFLAVIGGCRGNVQENQDPHEAVLREVWNLYRGGPKAIRQHPPAKLRDLRAQQTMYSRGYSAIKSGEVVVPWGVDLNKLADPATTVFAYEKETPEKGGLVLMADGNIDSLTPEQFRSAPKAKS